MLLSRIISTTSPALVLFAAIPMASAQESELPPRPDSRIHDAGSVFGAGDRSKLGDEIQGKLESLHAEAGCDVLVATVTSTTGTSPRALADQLAAAWLDPGKIGAVLLFERAGNKVAVSITDPARELIADYVFASIEQSAAEDREDAPPADAVSLAAGDLVAVFRKYYGEDSGREHPAIRADRILFGAVAACLAAMIAVVATLHWRGEMARST